MKYDTNKLNDLRKKLIEIDRSHGGICSHNHDLYVYNGWVYIDSEQPIRLSEFDNITERAKRLYNEGYFVQYGIPMKNSYSTYSVITNGEEIWGE